MLDERQYRDNQPCNDLPGPPCPELPQARDFLGRRQMSWIKERLRASEASWKLIGNELPIMPAKVAGNYVPEFDAWQGYPTERRELLTYLRDRRIQGVAFLAGDVHYGGAGDVRIDDDNPDSVVAHEFIGFSISSAAPGESTFNLGGGLQLRGNDRAPRTDPALITALEGFNPWIDAVDIDHHGYAVVEASPRELEVTLRRMRTIKQRSRARLRDFKWTIERDTRSILGQERST
jgi:alkaline phosphatase D